MATTWRNWAGNVTCTPTAIAQPASAEEVCAVLADARRRGQSARPAGSGHSFAPLCATDGVVLDLSLLAGVEAVDAERGTATVLAGTRIADLGEPLLARGVALANQGDIDRQAIAGAVATGTHGTGPGLGSLATFVRAIEVATPAGELVRYERETGGDGFRAAALGLGTVGVATRLELDVVPAYRLRAATRPLPWDEGIAAWPEAAATFRNTEIFWLPAHDTCVLKTLAATDDPVEEAAPLPPAEPGTVERYLVPHRVDWSSRIYPSERAVPFVELEYAVPLAAGMDAFAALRDLMRTRHPDETWAVEFRTQAADDLLLSTTQGADVATISIHEAIDRDHRPFFADAERLFREAGGRPHWGKLNLLPADELRGLYPALGRFAAVRSDVDPDGTLLNPYLRALVG